MANRGEVTQTRDRRDDHDDRQQSPPLQRVLPAALGRERPDLEPPRLGLRLGRPYVELGQYAPRRVSTAGIVFAMIVMSSQTDQFSR